MLITRLTLKKNNIYINKLLKKVKSFKSLICDIKYSKFGISEY